MIKKTKFEKLLTGGNDAILNKRASLLLKSTKSIFENKINELNFNKNKIEMDIERLTDISPENTYSLRPGGTNYDPEKWTRDLIKLKTAIWKIDIEIDVATKTFDEWFKEEIDVN